jgi:hypothetical protein
MRLPNAKALKTAAKKLSSHVYKEKPLLLWKCKEHKITSKSGQTEGDFRAQFCEIAREDRDPAVAKLGKKFAARLERAQEAVKRADARVDDQQAQLEQQKMSTAVSVGSTLLGALFGCRVRSSATVTGAGTAVRAAGRVRREKDDVARAAARAKQARQKLIDLEDKFQDEVSKLETGIAPATFTLTKTSVRPRKSDLTRPPIPLTWHLS